MILSDEIAKIERGLSERGLTVKALCEAAGIDQSTWTRWKGGSNAPMMHTWQRVCAAFNRMVAPDRDRGAA